MKRFLLILLLIQFNSNAVRIEGKLAPVYKQGSFGCKTIWRDISHPCSLTFPSGNSFNWSGYVVSKNFTTQPPNTVKKVAGEWIVPDLAASRNHTYTATWVGIDGFGDSNPTVQQVGTEQEFVSGQQVNYAWIEIFPAPAMVIQNVPVNVGDKIRASVTFLGNNKYKLFIKNLTRNVSTSFERPAPQARRSVAEWVVEAPSNNGVLPLANFGKVTFSNCQVIIGGVTGKIKNTNWQRFKLDMVTQTGVKKAVTSSINAKGNGFSVTWKHQ